ncbi:hypothetical protein SCALM49S_08350 [Streptomyces californicus]
MDIKPLIKELRERVSEELDYELEAQAQREHAAEFADDPDVLIPQVVHQSDQVLVTEWIDGIPLSEVVAEGTEEQRDRAGQLLARFLFRPGAHRTAPRRPASRATSGCCRRRRAIRRVSGGSECWTSVARSTDLPRRASAREPSATPCDWLWKGDAAGVYRLLREEGFVKESIDLDPDAVLDYLLPIIEPTQVEEFTFTRGWLREQAARIADPRSPAHQLGRQLNLPPSYVLIHRVTLSTIGVLCQLGATVRMRDELEAWLPGFLVEEEPEEFLEGEEPEALPAQESPEAEGARAERAEGESPEAEGAAGDNEALEHAGNEGGSERKGDAVEA